MPGGNPERHIEVGIDGKFRHWDYGVLRAGLVCYQVVPVQHTEFKVLTQCGAEHLCASAILRGEGVFIEIKLVLHIFHGSREPGISPGNGYFSTQTQGTGFVEIVIPHEVV